MDERKSVTRFLWIISEWIGRKSGFDDERDGLLDDESLVNDMGEVAWPLIGCMRKSIM